MTKIQKENIRAYCKNCNFNCDNCRYCPTLSAIAKRALNKRKFLKDIEKK